MIELHGKTYELIENEKNGFDETALNDRYSEILAKYDFIVGDWGYEQLRLKGFYTDRNTKAPLDSRISTLDDYLYEYCNFGCAYFVLKKVDR
ncbi:YutD family protein [Virgibacillus xinjiangensis]|uniref:YutD family protein n=1 Tax=Virgibacillus xinjiangensis TaxID=393090 RepID=A0ABV7CY13_9BACI